PTPAAEPPKAAAPPAEGMLSCLGAAAEVLKGAAEPMRCRELVDAMAARGLWSSTAPTPHQTLASALLREITKKGAASRFRKADRGRFALNAG
ncbi:MAG TPA: winged helix-turn-helix domain-containing protein, partial [Humisphaera sp.]